MKYKIITVSGCSNCPFLQVWYSNEKLSCGTCKHKSFNTELGSPKIDIKLLTSGDGYSNPVGIPDWCPLD